MREPIHPPQLDQNVRRALSTPDPDPAFVVQLQRQLNARAITLSGQRPRRVMPQPWPRLTWIMLAGCALLLVVLIRGFVPPRPNDELDLPPLGPTPNVSPAVATVTQVVSPLLTPTGVIAPVRRIAEPVIAVRDGITLTITEARTSAERTWIFYTLDSIQNPTQSIFGVRPICEESAQVRQPDGSLLMLSGGGTSTSIGDAHSQNHQYSQSHRWYSPIQPQFDRVTFVLPCINETWLDKIFDRLLGKTPQNWEVPIHLVPDARFSPSPAPSTDIANTSPAVTSDFDISIAVEQFYPLAEGYALLGRTTSNDPRLVLANSYDRTGIEIFDALGQQLLAVPIEPYDDKLPALEPQQWLYKLEGKVFHAPLTIRRNSVTAYFINPSALTLDLPDFDGSDAQLGRTWEVGPIPLALPGLEAKVRQVKYIEGHGRGFEIGIEADPRLEMITFEWAVPTSDNRASGSLRAAPDDLLLAQLLTYEPLKSPFYLSLGRVVLKGRWETSWEPPVVDPAITPTPIPPICLTRASWQAVLANSTPPPALTGKLLIGGVITENGENVNASFVVNFDGSGEQKLGNHQSYSLLPDGTKVVYTAEDGLHSIDLINGSDQPVPDTSVRDYVKSNSLSGSTSPDGQIVALIEGGLQPRLFTARIDGSARRLLAQIEQAGISKPVWSPDGQYLIINVDDYQSPDYYDPQPILIDLATCQVTSLPQLAGRVSAMIVYGWSR